MTDLYLNLFRNLIPPIMGQIDMTPIFGFLVLQFAAQVRRWYTEPSVSPLGSVAVHHAGVSSCMNSRTVCT